MSLLSSFTHLGKKLEVSCLDLISMTQFAARKTAWTEEKLQSQEEERSEAGGAGAEEGGQLVTHLMDWNDVIL